MTNSPFKNALSAAMMVSAMTFPAGTARAEIHINTDTGVTLKTVRNAGVEPEIRIIIPARSQNITEITQPLPTPPSPSVRAAARIAEEVDSTLVTVDKPIASPRDDSLAEQNTLINFGTDISKFNEENTDQRIAPSTVISNSNRGLIRNQMLNTTLGAPTGTMGSVLSETNTTLSNDTGIAARRSNSNLTPRDTTYTDRIRGYGNSDGGVGSENRTGAATRTDPRFEQ